MGRGFKEPVRMYEVVEWARAGTDLHPDYFDFGKSGVNGKALPADLAFAGFRVQAATNWNSDVAAFLGASYFRADRQ